MLKDEIIEKAKQKPFRVYFDMDGVCSEERTGEHDLIVANAKDFYLNKRPMKTMLKVMKELHDAGVEVGILSSCWYLEQADQKRQWLKTNAPFVKEENEHFVVYETITFTKEEKPYLKAWELEKITKGYDGEFLLIEDRHANVKAVNKYFGKFVAEHVSCLFEYWRGSMHHEYRNLGEGVVDGDYKFGQLEAQTVLLASRKDDIFELGFYEMPIFTGEKNRIKFVSDDKFLPIKDLTILGNDPKEYYQKVARNMKTEFLKENPTPNLRELRALNKRIINTQKNIKNNESVNEK